MSYKTSIKSTAHDFVTNIENQLNEKFANIYDSLCIVDEKTETLGKNVIELMHKEIDVCNIPSTIEKLTKLQSDATEIVSSAQTAMYDITSIQPPDMPETPSITNDSSNNKNDQTQNENDQTQNENDQTQNENDQTQNENDLSNENEVTVPKGLEKYPAFALIAKKFEIIKLKLKKIKITIEKLILKLNKKVLTSIVESKGSSTPAAATINTATMTIAMNCLIILNILSAILTLINSMFPLNIEGGCCCLFMTPKSLTKTTIAIANANMSANDIIPPAVDESLTAAETTIEKSNGAIKKAKIAAGAAAGSASAQAGGFSIPDFGTLPKFDSSIIRTAVNAVLQLLIGSEPLPRYEKLHLINIKFLTYLLTGFEPSAKMSFGIPGMP